jgi:glutaredoxin-related protein
MGSSVSGTIAEIYIQFLEELYVKQWLDSKQILYYKRYVDDILIIYNQSKTNEQDILNHANNIRGWVQKFPAWPAFKVTEIKHLCYFSI